MILPFALLFAAQVAEASPSSGDPGPVMTADCNARMVEIPVTMTVKGLPKQTKVKICGKIGQSDADWAVTLKDALGKVEANSRMPAAVKEQVVTGLRIEIAKLPVASAAAPPPPKVSPAPTIVPVTSAPPVLAPRPSIDTSRAEYSTYAPLPAPKAAPAPTTLAAAVAAAPPPLPAPRLTFRCLSTTSTAGDGPCDLLERGMVVTVRADEDIAAGTSLHFVRRGDDRAEVDLDALRRGQSKQFSLPARVCQGVSGSRVEIQVIRAAGKSTQIVDTHGPFELRC
jgi:hypothetical protein